jgi:multidrug efflux pump subunit AcrB
MENTPSENNETKAYSTHPHAHQKDDTSPRSTGIVLFAVRYPYFIVVACLIVFILGVLSAVALPKDLLPISHQPAVQILSFYQGMPVHEVATDLTARIERYTDQAIGIEKQDSKSLEGVSVVRNYFDPKMDLNTAISQSTAMVMSVLRKLPPGTQPPLILPFDPTSSVPLALVAVSGDFPEKHLAEIARYDVRNAILSVSGAMAPTVMGGVERRAIVYLDQKRLNRYNFSPLDVLAKMNSMNTFIPTGDLRMGDTDYQILSNGLAETVSDMNDYPLRSQNGITVSVKDIGQAKDDHAIQTNVVMIDGKRQVYVPIYRQPGANSLSVVDNVKKRMARLEQTLGGITLKVVADQSEFIRHAIHGIAEETLIGGGLAALMVFFFLGNPRATGGILLSIPLALLFALLGLNVSGQTLNAMTLGGLALSIGVLVDNSIVVLENIAKKKEMGAGGLQAAIEGSSEVAMPVMASTLCTLVVLFPIIFLNGISKVLFSALALSVTFAMVGSYFIAMTVIPLFAARFLKERPPQIQDLMAPLRIAQQAVARVTQWYGSLLLRVLRKKWILFAAVVVLLVIGGAAATRMGSELFPRADAGNFVFKARLRSGLRIEETEKFAREMNDKIRQWIPPSDLSMIITNAGLLYGYPAAFTPNTGTQDVFFLIELKEDRKQTSQYYASVIRKKMAEEFPDVDVGMELGGLLTSALNGGLGSPIDVQVIGPDVHVAHQAAESVLPAIKKLRGAVDVRIQQRTDLPELFLNVDRKKAGALGLSVDDVMKSVVSTVSGSFSFNPAIWVDPKTGIDYLFGVQMPTDEVTDIEQLRQTPLTGSHQDRSVPLSRVAQITETKGSSEINHVNLEPVVDIFLDGQGRDVGSLSNDVQKILDQAKWPKGYKVEIRGEIKEMNSTVNDLKGGFLLATILVYLILVIQFKSFKTPAIVLATVPIGVVGIILMLVLTKTYFSIQAAIGAIFMIGIAVANGVLLIEFILHKVHELPSHSDKMFEAAIIDASRLRLRPIMMTSLASILGLVPMALGFGHGSEANIPLGRAVIGGQILATLLTLFLVPTLFMIFGKKSEASK